MLSLLRTHRALLLLSLVALIALAGCGDDDPASPTGDNHDNQTGGNVTCSVDGSAMTFSNGSGVANEGVVAFGGSVADTDNVIVISVTDAVGTYALGSVDGISFSLTLGSDIYSATSGSVVVTAVDSDHIEGTFSASLVNFVNASDTIAVTGGAFDVPVVR